METINEVKKIKALIKSRYLTIARFAYEKGLDIKELRRNLYRAETNRGIYLKGFNAEEFLSKLKDQI